MNHSYESRPTFYNGVLFRTRLEARWACFFDLAAWKWDYEPIDLVGWTPTFRVEFPCSHTECAGSHVLLVDVKPFYHLSEFTGLRCMDFPFGIYEKPDGSIETIPADASAAFGIRWLGGIQRSRNDRWSKRLFTQRSSRTCLSAVD